MLRVELRAVLRDTLRGARRLFYRLTGPAILLPLRVCYLAKPHILVHDIPGACSSQHLYGTAAVKIPRPELYMVYTGTRSEVPEVLHLSDLYEGEGSVDSSGCAPMLPVYSLLPSHPYLPDATPGIACGRTQAAS